MQCWAHQFNLVVLQLFMKFELMAAKVKVSLKVVVGPESFVTSLFRTGKQVIVLFICGSRIRDPFLESPGNLPSPITICSNILSPITQ